MIEARTDILNSERRIVWKEPPDSFPYLRESLAVHTQSRGPIAYHGAGRIVGYAELHGPNGGGVYFRRFWWFADHDPYPEFIVGNTDRHPTEAVDPEYIVVGQPSVPAGVVWKAWRESVARRQP